MGLGVLIAKNAIDKTIIQGGTGNNSAELLQGNQMPEDFESGTINVPAICGFSAGLDFVKKRSIRQIYNHETALIDRLFKGLSKNDKVILYCNPQKGGYLPVLSFNVEGKNSAETAMYLNNYHVAVRAGLHCAPMAHKQINTLDIGTVRVSVSVYNTMEEVEYLLRVIKNIKNL